MCGRYTLAKQTDETMEHFGIVDIDIDKLLPSYNIAPGQHVPTVIARKDTSDRVLKHLHWGLAPSWIRDFEESNKPINARSETAAEKPFFRKAMKVRRCVIPADGFYEWAKRADRKQPYYFQFEDGSIFGFAGLWEHWEGGDGRIVQSCAIMTSEPNDLCKTVHSRMPVILKPDDYARWLDPKIQDPARVKDLLVPYPANEMTAHPVSRYVNSPDHNDPKCIEKASNDGEPLLL